VCKSKSLKTTDCKKRCYKCNRACKNNYSRRLIAGNGYRNYRCFSGGFEASLIKQSRKTKIETVKTLRASKARSVTKPPNATIAAAKVNNKNITV